MSTVELIDSVPETHLAHKLGKFLVRNKVSVSEAATKLKVSRQAVYNILQAKSYPKPELEQAILDLIKG